MRIMLPLFVLLLISGSPEASVPRSPSPPAWRTEAQPYALGQPPAGQPAQEEFVPIEELPPTEQLPAAPLLVTAYAFAWVALLGYLWSIWRRLSRVEQDLAEVARSATERKRT